MSVVKKLYDNSLLEVPHLFVLDTELEVIMGSTAYGASMGNSSDKDVHGFCIPDKEIIFPNTRHNYIHGFSDPSIKFDSFQQHHIDYNTDQYDVCVYSIVKLFSLAKDNNPNVLDILWTPEDCHLKVSPIAQHVLDNRKYFLSKAAYNKFLGFAHGQIKKAFMSKRREIINQYGYDVKHAYHIIRLGLQLIDILTDWDMDLRAHSSKLIDIRSGIYSQEEIFTMFDSICSEVELLMKSTNIPTIPNIILLEKVLMECLEMKYKTI